MAYGWTDGQVIHIARHPHIDMAHGHEMVATLVHEMVHYLRPEASEAWVRRREGKLVTDHEVRADAAVRLLNAVLFDDEVKGE